MTAIKLNIIVEDPIELVPKRGNLAIGTRGEDGLQVELSKNDTHIQWRYVGETNWHDLIAIAALKGDAGADGDDGSPIEIRATATHLQWKYIDTVSWVDFLAIADITGQDGREVELQKSATHIQWRYFGEANWTDLVALADLKGTDGTDGSDGREVELQKSATHIQWRFVGEVSWINLVALADLKGDAGQDGSDGREVQLQKSSTHIQWRYTGETTWNDLLALSDIKGDPGDAGTEIELQKSATHIQWRYIGGTWTDLVALADLKGDAGADGVGMPAGGTTGQVPRKASNTNFDFEWYTPTSGVAAEQDYKHLMIPGLSMTANTPHQVDIFNLTGEIIKTPFAISVRVFQNEQQVAGMKVLSINTRGFQISSGETGNFDIFVSFVKSPKNRFEFAVGTSPTVASLQTTLGITLQDAHKVGDTIYFANEGWTIGNGKFANNTNLLNVHTHASIINQFAFAGCANLKSITAPVVTSLPGAQTFSGCNALSYIYMPIVQSIGFDHTNNFVFAINNPDPIMATFPAAMQTINAGALEGDLAWMSTNNTVTFTWT